MSSLNPIKLMKLKGTWERFQSDHPQFTPFLQAVGTRGLQEGAVLELSVTDPAGQPLRYRMTVTAQDMELFRELQDMTK